MQQKESGSVNKKLKHMNDHVHSAGTQSVTQKFTGLV